MGIYYSKNVEKEHVLMLVDESYQDDFCAVCVVCIQGKRRIEAVRNKVSKMKLEPQIIATTTGEIRHYVEDSIGGRQFVASFLGLMPISAYLCLSQTSVPVDKKSQDEYAYAVLLPKIIKSLLQKYKYNQDKQYSISIEFENLSNKKEVDLAFFNKHLSHLQNEFQFTSVVVGKEEEQLLFLPDYFLGFTRDVILKKRKMLKKSPQSIEKIETWPAQSFNLLLNKIGVILQVNKDKTQRFGRGEEVRKFLAVHTIE